MTSADPCRSILVKYTDYIVLAHITSQLLSLGVYAAWKRARFLPTQPKTRDDNNRNTQQDSI